MREQKIITLQEAGEVFAEKKRKQRRVEEARKRLQLEKLKLDGLTQQMQKEEFDVKKLEEASLTSLFHQVLGTKEAKLDKERQEFLAAKLKHDSCRNSVLAMEREIEYLETQIREFGNIEQIYKKLLQEKATTIAGSSSAEYRRLIQRETELRDKEKEIFEAIEAGSSVLPPLDEVISGLKSAGNWGVADLLGGGLIITAVKHSKIDRAKQGIHEVQQKLHRFSREMADIETGPGTDMNIEISSFNTFADYFIDGLIFDWVVQSKIDRSKKGALKLQSEIKTILDELNNQMKTIKNEIKELQETKTRFLEKQI